MDRDAFLASAQRVAGAGAKLADPANPTTERHALLDTAGALARYFVANVSSLHSNSFYEGLGALPWVPASKVRRMGHTAVLLPMYDLELGREVDVRLERWHPQTSRLTWR
jgi:hypothetical protein